ncbi:MAG: alpha/beta hydrolase [Planctomycetota bacterium]
MMCKRNVVFFLQQFVASPNNRRGSDTAPSTRSTIHLPEMWTKIRPPTLSVIACILCLCAAGMAAGQESVSDGLADNRMVDGPVADLAARPGCGVQSDRVYLVSSRHLPDSCVSHRWTSLRFYRSEQGRYFPLTADQYQSEIDPRRTVVFYVHGNRMPADELMKRAAAVRCQIRSRLADRSVDWIVFSWPSDRNGIGVRDFRRKAERCDLEAVHLAGLVKQHVDRGCSINMVSYSFGARVATGSLHMLAGGKLGCLKSPEPPCVGSAVRLGLIAPAIESHWLASRGYHGLATKNMESLTLLYNRRDAVLKRYWLLDKVRRETALGFSGPTSFAARVDGSRLPVRSRDCSPSVKLRHSELDYYGSTCNAGCDLARMIQLALPHASCLCEPQRIADATTGTP